MPPAQLPESNGLPHHSKVTQNGHATAGSNGNHMAGSVPAGGTPPGPIMGVEALTQGARKVRGAKGEPWRVAAVIPGFGKHKDVELLLKDLGRLDVRGIEFWAVVVDNATPGRPLSDVAAPANLRVEHHRLNENTGGAGGFNAAMHRVLAGEGLSGEFEPPDFLWLVDSDARVSRKSLRELVKALIRHKKLCAVGSALVDRATGSVYEIGGRVGRQRGDWYPAAAGNPDERLLVKCDYLAACSALVRREAIEITGLMPEIFIHGDDVQWMLRLQKATGQKVAGVVTSRVYHPHFLIKFQSWTRYYGCRNSFAAIDTLGLGGKVRYKKAMIEVERAISQSMMALDELAELHLQGIQDAAARKTKGQHITIGRDRIIQTYKTRPIGSLAAAVREDMVKMGPGTTVWLHPLLISHPADFSELKVQARELGLSLKVSTYWKHRHRMSFKTKDGLKAMWRALVAGPTADIAIVPTGWPTGWFRGKVHYEVTPDGYFRRDIHRWERLQKAASVLWRGWNAARAVARRPEYVDELPKAPVRVRSGAADAVQRVGEEQRPAVRDAVASV